MQELAVKAEFDFESDVYKDAYSRINAIVIEGPRSRRQAVPNTPVFSGWMPKSTMFYPLVGC